MPGNAWQILERRAEGFQQHHKTLVTIIGRKENIVIDILIQANKFTPGFHFLGHPSATLLGSGQPLKRQISGDKYVLRKCGLILTLALVKLNYKGEVSKHMQKQLQMGLTFFSCLRDFLLPQQAIFGLWTIGCFDACPRSMKANHGYLGLEDSLKGYLVHYRKGKCKYVHVIYICKYIFTYLAIPHAHYSGQRESYLCTS